MFEEIDINELIDDINYMLEVVEGESGSSPFVSNFLLSTVGKQDLKFTKFRDKVDSRIYDAAITVMYLMRADYFTIIDILNNAVLNNEELLEKVSQKNIL